MLIKANMKRQRGSMIGIFTFMFLISISFCAVIAFWNNAKVYETEQLMRLGYGDITQWCANVKDEEALLQQIKGLKEVRKVEEEQLIFASDIRDETTILAAYAKKYAIYREDHAGFLSNAQEPSKQEVYLPIALANEQHLEIGDTLNIQWNDKDSRTYRIKGFFEDPIMGSSVMGIKTILMNPQETEELRQLALHGETDTLIAGNAYHLFQQEDTTLTSNEFQSILNEQTDLKNNTLFSYSDDTVLGFMLIMQEMFSGFLLLFVMILLGVAMLVLGHSISSSIDQDYVDMGILKAVGFSNHKLRSYMMMQYGLIVLIPLLMGMPASAFVVRFINQITVPSTGILIPSTLPMILCSMVILSILFLVLIFIFIKTRKLVRITPLSAIHGGQSDVYFHSRIRIAIFPFPLSISLALRQLISGKKQYFSAGIVSALLVFFLSFTTGFGNWIGPNGEGLIQSFSAAPADFDVTILDTTSANEIIQKVQTIAPLEHTFEFINVKGEVNHVNYILNVISEPDYYQLLEGRTCRYDNEIVLTEFIAEELGVSIGDEVKVSYEGKQENYLITGINQCANDMGGNISMNKAGFQRLTKKDLPMEICFSLKDATQKEDVMKQLQHVYQDRIQVSDNSWSGVDQVLAVMSALEIFLYVIVMFFILVVILMTGSKMLYREQRDMGIYKSLGFSSQRLQLAFALRFAITALLGAFIGILLSFGLSNWIASQFLRLIGISVYQTQQDFTQLLFPVVLVVCLFFLFAYLEAYKIKKVEAILLIQE